MRISDSSAKLIGKILRSVNGTQEDAVAVFLTLGSEENAQEFFSWWRSLTRDPTPQECFEKAVEIAGYLDAEPPGETLDSLVPNDKCPECKKYQGMYVCEAYPTWVPDEASDGACPQFEQKEQENDEYPGVPTAEKIKRIRHFLQKAETEAAKPGSDPFLTVLARAGQRTLEEMKKDCPPI